MVIATEQDLIDMIDWFGEHLDQWCHKYLRFNIAALPDQWSFITSYNLLEAIQALEVKSKSTIEASCVKDELIRTLGQVVLCIFQLGVTLGIKPSALILQGGKDFCCFQAERYGVSYVHLLRRWCLKRVKDGVDTKGNHKKILTGD